MGTRRASPKREDMSTPHASPKLEDIGRRRALSRPGDPDPRRARAWAALSAAALAVLLMATGCSGLVPATPTPAPTESPAPSQPPPTLTAGPSAPGSSPTPAGVAYRIRAGDTLSSIAARFHRTMGQLLTANPGITDPDQIQIGEVIVIPAADAPDLPPTIASLADPANDMVDQTGSSTPGQAYADALGLTVNLKVPNLLVALKLVSGPPPLDPSVEQLTMTFNVDASGDGQPDFTIVWSNAIGGQNGYAASLTDRNSGQVLLGASFPGTAAVSGAVLRISVPVSALGGGRSFRMAAAVERQFFPGGPGDSETEYSLDMVPNQQWPHPNAQWVTVGR